MKSHLSETLLRVHLHLPEYGNCFLTPSLSASPPMLALQGRPLLENSSFSSYCLILKSPVVWASPWAGITGSEEMCPQLLLTMGEPLASSAAPLNSTFGHLEVERLCLLLKAWKWIQPSPWEFFYPFPSVVFFSLLCGSPYFKPPMSPWRKKNGRGK